VISKFSLFCTSHNVLADPVNVKYQYSFGNKLRWFESHRVSLCQDTAL